MTFGRDVNKMWQQGAEKQANKIKGMMKEGEGFKVCLIPFNVFDLSTLFLCV
jgi:hypothetical protein